MIYVDPEVLEERSVDSKADVYSYSMIAYRILTGIKPAVEGNSYMQMKNAIKGRRPDLSIIEDKDIKNLLQKCFSKNPKNRPSFDEIIDFLIDKNFYSRFKIDINEISKYIRLFNESYCQILPKFFNLPKFKFYVYLVGDSVTGKTWTFTSYIERKIHDKYELIETRANDWRNFIFQTVLGETEVIIYDNPGMEKYWNVTKKMIQKSDAFVLFTGVGKNSIKRLQFWIDQIHDISNDPLLFIAITHIDDEWEKTLDEFQAFADEKKAKIFVIPWNDLEKIDLMFNQIADDLSSITFDKYYASYI